MNEYVTIRDILGWAIGHKIIEITQHDQEEWDTEKVSYVELMLDNGGTVKFFTGEEAFSYFDPNNPDNDEEDDEEDDDEQLP